VAASTFKDKNYSNRVGLVGKVGILELTAVAECGVIHKHFLPAIMLNIHGFLSSAKIFRYKCYIKSNVMHTAERLHLLIKLPPILGLDSAANDFRCPG